MVRTKSMHISFWRSYFIVRQTYRTRDRLSKDFRQTGLGELTEIILTVFIVLDFNKLYLRESHEFKELAL